MPTSRGCPSTCPTLSTTWPMSAPGELYSWHRTRAATCQDGKSIWSFILRMFPPLKVNLNRLLTTETIIFSSICFILQICLGVFFWVKFNCLKSKQKCLDFRRFIKLSEIRSSVDFRHSINVWLPKSSVFRHLWNFWNPETMVQISDTLCVWKPNTHKVWISDTCFYRSIIGLRYTFSTLWLPWMEGF